MSYCLKTESVDHNGETFEKPIGSVLHIEHAADLENITLEDFIANKSANGWVDVQVETELTLLGFHQFMGMNGKSPYHTPKKGEDGSWSALMYPNSWI